MDENEVRNAAAGDRIVQVDAFETGCGWRRNRIVHVDENELRNAAAGDRIVQVDENELRNAAAGVKIVHMDDPERPGAAPCPSRLELPLIWIDAFAEALFEGNPAAVMPLPHWLPDETLQALAAENNLSETAFYVSALPIEASREAPEVRDAPEGTEAGNADAPSYHLRWFTPSVEVDLCGHATLATGAQLFQDVHPEAPSLRFWTRSGWLGVERTGPRELTLDFPSEPLRPVAPDPMVVAALGLTPTECLRATDLVYLADDSATVANLKPNLAALAELDARGVIVTAQGDADSEYDFVSRWFGGGAGIGEDPVTGSAHSQIAPYWAARLGRSRLTARQLSRRGGTLRCQVVGGRVLITGTYRRYLDATVHLDAAL